MTVLEQPTSPPVQRIVVAPASAGLALAGGLLIIGAVLVLQGASTWGLVVIGCAVMCAAATAWWTFRTLQQQRHDLALRHSRLDAEYGALQADYATLERVFDELQAAYATLERCVDERTVERDQKTNQLQRLLDESLSHAAQLAALNDMATALNATLDRNEVLTCILRQLERVVAFDSAAVLQLVDDELQVIAARGLTSDIYNLRLALHENELARRVLASSAPIVLADVRDESSFVLKQTPIRSWIGVALRVGERTVGVLTVDNYECGAYSAEDARLVANFASQAALSLHNAHLYAESERRAAETSLLLEMTRTVGSSLHLPEVLLRAAAAIGEALHADDVVILLLDELGERLIPQAGATGATSYLRERWPGPTLLEQEPSLAKVIQQGCARVMHTVSPTIPYATLLALPLSIKDQVLGVVLVATPDGDAAWGPQQLVLAEGLATSAALAIEHARLYDQARRAAQVEERSRLARELHDSVTQTLFSMTLTAEAARAQIDRNPERAALQIDRLKAAAHQSLGEMRELLLQLRPTPLQEHGLVKALRDHISTLNARDVQITLNVAGDDRNVKQQAAGFYRIAQEAIANALRHAEAHHIIVNLNLQPHELELQVCDDGLGFDPASLERGGRHLGLTSMAERAAELGGSFDLATQPGNGTTLTVKVRL